MGKEGMFSLAAVAIKLALVAAVANAAEANDSPSSGWTVPHSAAATQGSEPPPDLESRGFRVTYRDAGGRELTRREFTREVEGHEVSMAVDGKNRTATISIVRGMSPIPEISIGVELGAQLPPLGLPDLGGEIRDYVRTDSKPTVVDVFFSACGPCILEVPELNDLAARRSDVATLAITFDSADEAHKFVRKFDFRWSVVPAAKNYIERIGVTGYPTTLLVGPDRTLWAIRHSAAKAAKEEPPKESLDAWVTRVLTEVAAGRPQR